VAEKTGHLRAEAASGLSPQGNPAAADLLGIFACLQQLEGRD
jgi:hypothetical protein